MKFTNIPREYWDWRCTSLLVAIAALPILSLTWLSSNQPHRLAFAAGLDSLVRGPAAVAATLCLYIAWRLSGQRQLAWLTAVTGCLAIQSVLMAGLQLSDIQRQFGASLWGVPFDLLTMVVVARLSLAAGRDRYRGDPIRIAVVCGLVLGGGRVAAICLLPDASVPHLGALLTLTGFAAVVVPPVILLALVPDLPRWATGRLAAALFLYALAHLAARLSGTSASVSGRAITLAADLAGAVFLTASAIGLLRMTIVAGDADRDQLRLRVGELEAGARLDRARIHEINSTIAGLVSASRLLRDDTSITATRRALMEQMIHAELGRLQRLLRESTPGGADADASPDVVDLDDTIGNLVLAHEVRGNRVSWLPSGARVAGHKDEIAEVLNILLDNAAKHGGAGSSAGDTSVTVEDVADAIEVAVADNGPGIAPEVRQRLFEWEARGPSSRGQGIGLHIAQDLTRRHGGRLTVRDAARGATFVARFPKARRGDDEPAHLS